MEEQNDIELEDTTESPAAALGMALQWLCSMRGGNNFFGRLLNGCSHVVDYNLPYESAAAVGLDSDGRYQLIYSPDKYKKYAPPLRTLVLVHEAAHLALRHLERILRAQIVAPDMRKFSRLHEVLNVAADMAANDVAIRPLLCDKRNHFDTCEEHFIWPEERGYPAGETFEEYFILLLKDMEKHGFDSDFDPNADLQAKLDAKNQQAGSGGGEGASGENDSCGGGDSNNTEPQILQGGTRPGDDLDDNYPNWFKALVNKSSYTAVLWNKPFEQMTTAEVEGAIENARRDAKRLVRSAVEQTEKCRGTIPSNMQRVIADLLGDPTIPWQEVFRGMIRSSISAKLDESTAYPNIAWAGLEGIEPYPGMQKNFTFNILVGVDTSGSVGDDEFKEFLQEILAITDVEQGINARVVMFDAAMQKEEILSDEVISSARATGYGRAGYGGTDFTPYLKYVNQKDEEDDWIPGAEREDLPLSYPIDLAILFTDGYAPVGPPGGPIPEYLPNCPLIWALTPSGQANDYMQPRVVRIGEC
jgi:predicted metal-dependent peptidase